ncbi:MAG TPA: MBL fold metallo-hydrolase [Pseudomonadaceae bacterium]|nr:MBL fold metallo-hydrolase [Pseudomonadaceae bacterium]
MNPSLTRRALFPALATGSLGLALFSRSLCAAGSSIEAVDIADRLTLFSGAGGHVLVQDGPESLLLVDGGSPQHAVALLDAITERFDGKPVTALINTHWHLDQTGANDILGAVGVPIIAHEHTRRWMMRRIEPSWGAPLIPPRAEAALPTRTFRIQDEWLHDAQQIGLYYTPRAHTDGDIHAVFPASKVIAAGGIAYGGSWPVLDTVSNGWIGELLDATRVLLSRCDDSTTIVPAAGRLVTRDDLLAQEEMLDTILGRFRSMSAKGLGSDDMLREGIAADYEATYGDSTEFILSAWDGLSDHMRGLGAF